MHGLSPGIRDGWTASASLPVSSLPAACGSALGSPTARPSRTEPIFQGGLSLACNENPISRSPSQGPCSLPARRISHRTFAEIRSGPMLHTASPVSAPLWGFFIPLRIAAFNRLRCLEAHLRKTPDLPSLPAASTVKCRPRIDVPGPLRLARFVVPVNLLEPRSSCAGGPVRVK